jgi:hypothetical protein
MQERQDPVMLNIDDNMYFVFADALCMCSVLCGCLVSLAMQS